MSIAPVTDGRVLRGARTRSGIVQALLDLLNDGVLTPTAAQIADRAGVSVRSVFQHFADMEALYGDLAAEQRERIAPLLAGLERPELLADRIAALVTQRSELFETIAPVRHAIGTRAFESAALQERLTELAASLREQVESQFAPEVQAQPPRRRRPMVDTLDLLTSFEAWDRLRVVQRLDRRQTEQTLADVLAAVLT
jgi:TetR/AcrR family transcriptional regulator, regulator of autoinduction and epiphytic fitness